MQLKQYFYISLKVLYNFLFFECYAYEHTQSLLLVQAVENVEKLKIVYLDFLLIFFLTNLMFVLNKNLSIFVCPAIS